MRGSLRQWASLASSWLRPQEKERNLFPGSDKFLLKPTRGKQKKNILNQMEAWFWLLLIWFGFSVGFVFELHNGL